MLANKATEQCTCNYDQLILCLLGVRQRHRFIKFIKHSMYSEFLRLLETSFSRIHIIYSWIQNTGSNYDTCFAPEAAPLGSSSCSCCEIK